MDKEQAYNAFWSGFGVLAFEENSVPDDSVIQQLIDAGVAKSKYPYIAYQVITDDLGHPVYPTASIYDRSSSWQRIDTLANAISAYIQRMNTIKYFKESYDAKGIDYEHFQTIIGYNE